MVTIFLVKRDIYPLRRI